MDTSKSSSNQEDRQAGRQAATVSGPAVVWGLLRGYRVALGLTVLTGMAVHLFTIAGSTLSAYMVGQAITGAGSEQLRGMLAWLVALILPLAVLPWLEMTLSHGIAFHILADLRAMIYQAFERLAPGYLMERRSGDLNSAAMGDVEALELGLAHVLPPLLVALVVPACALAALAMIHWLLALVLFPFVAAVLVVPIWMKPFLGGRARSIREKLGAVGAEVVDGVQGLREIVVFGAHTRELQLLAAAESALRQAQYLDGRAKGWELGLHELLAGAGTLATALVACRMVALEELPTAFLPAAVILAASIFLPINRLMAAGRDFPTLFSAAKRIWQILDASPPVRDLVSAPPPGPWEPEISYEGVRFSYGPTLPEVLRGLSFTISPGESVALVGPSGGGKTTCANLLTRMWDVTGGRIAIGGHDIRDFPQETLRDLIAVVPQDVYLFNRSALDNIRMSRPSASDAEVVQAAQAAQAEEFIAAMPQGWDTVLGERGARLSGGQRQRIAIARALLKNTPIIILDEAVSNLDVESELLLQKALAQACRDRSTLVIAHRLSTIRKADRIVVLQDGMVAETGNYQELVSAGGHFARLTAQGTQAPA